MVNKFSPIILFVYNRPWHTEQTLNALMQNELADQSVLYIFSDGPKEDETEEGLKRIVEVRQKIRSKKWCNTIIINEAIKNKGLAHSIVDGVTELVNQNGKVIVLEDDVVPNKGFLKYMNDALSFYNNNKRVMHISAYMYPHHETQLPETFFYSLPYPGGGWATWQRAWLHYKDDANFLYEYFDKNSLWDKLNTAGGNFFQSQLENNAIGQLDTWFIKWHATLVIQKGLTLFPRYSLTHNIGFDNSGVHCGITTKFDNQVLAKYISVKKIPVKENQKAERIIKRFYEDFLYSGGPTHLKSKRVHVRKRMISLKILFKRGIRKLIYPNVTQIISENKAIKDLQNSSYSHNQSLNVLKKNSNFFNNPFESNISQKAKLYPPFSIVRSRIGDYTYVAGNSQISFSTIGKFCSMGPNLVCGWGIHPSNGISTAPMFYSTMKQNGVTLSSDDKVEERKPIVIGNDVFIGANVTILDGVTIGDGAIIGAGAVVSKDIPPYAIAVGCPIKVLKFRFETEQIEKLLQIKWWNFSEDNLRDVEKYFFEVEEFIGRYYKN